MTTINRYILQRAGRHVAVRTTATAALNTHVLIHRLLCTLMVTVVFEGLARKIAPQSLGMAIFFLKDFLVLGLLIFCLRTPPTAATAQLLTGIRVLLFLLIPCVALTALHDPILAVFGLKQYALFATVAVAVCIAYVPDGGKRLFALLRLIAISVVVTTVIAMIQNKLPASSWLNLSVSGNDLSDFAAAGYLRVSSTFPFVGQYCFYLNALCFLLPAYYFLNNHFTHRPATAQILVLVGLAIVGTYVTGSRSAVIGNAAILGAAALFCVLYTGSKAVARLAVFVILGFLLFSVLQSLYPQFFAAYKSRTEGTFGKSHTEEVIERVEQTLFGWTDGSPQAPPNLFGYGLGVMSNGSSKFSNYATQWRSNGFWTESDQATTFFEGGWYLVLVWYGFRLWVIVYSFSRLRKIRHPGFRISACFALAYIVVEGVCGTIAIQPPLAIWWWFAVGLITCLSFIGGRQSPASFKGGLRATSGKWQQFPPAGTTTFERATVIKRIRPFRRPACNSHSR